VVNFVCTGEDVIMVPLDHLRPNGWNPQTMTETEFDMLLSEIREDGFDEPILVVPDEDKNKDLNTDGYYVIISGEHRWQALKTLEAEAAPCIVKHHWDDCAQRVKTIRRNIIRGHLDAQRFTELCNHLHEKEKIALEEMATTLGFEGDKEFMRVYLEDAENKRDAADEMIANAGGATIDDHEAVQFLVDEIFAKYGDTMPHGYMCFHHKGKMNLIARMDDELSEMVVNMVDFLRSEAGEINQFLKESVSHAFEREKAKVAKVLAQIQEDEDATDRDEVAS